MQLFYTQTAGVLLTVQQPLNNIGVAIQALAGVLGERNLHTDA